ncbi:MAG: hypothetical protein ABIR70_23980 [Bryobacteraceae bacterium]
MASIAGLLLTVWTLFQAKAAASTAREVKARMFSLDTLSELSAAITLLGEVKTLQRLAAWDLVLDRYGHVRRHLVRIANLNDQLSPAHLAEVAWALNQFRTMEKKLESSRSAVARDTIDPAKYNEIVSKGIEKLESVMIAIKKVGI